MGGVDRFVVGHSAVGFVGSAAPSPQGIYIQSNVTTGALSYYQERFRHHHGSVPGEFGLVAGTQVEFGIEVDTLGNVYAYYNPTTGEAPYNTNGTL